MLKQSDGLLTYRRAMHRAGLVLASIALVVATCLATLALSGRAGGTNGIPSSVRADEFQSVLLTNGQLYFGKLSATDSQSYVLRHVYYLAAQTSRAGTPVQRTLLPLVKDVHGPEDTMVISREQVVYIENLRPTGAAARLLVKTAP